MLAFLTQSQARQRCQVRGGLAGPGAGCSVAKGTVGWLWQEQDDWVSQGLQQGAVPVSWPGHSFPALSSGPQGLGWTVARCSLGTPPGLVSACE